MTLFLLSTIVLSDETWALAMRLGAYLASGGVLAIVGWWAKNQASKTWLQKALSQFAIIMQGLASDVTSGMSAAVAEASADGKITKEERAALVARLVTLVKSSASSRFLSRLESSLGLQTGTFETWMRGMAAEHIDAQLATTLRALTVSTAISRPTVSGGLG